MDPFTQDLHNTAMTKQAVGAFGGSPFAPIPKADLGPKPVTFGEQPGILEQAGTFLTGKSDLAKYNKEQGLSFTKDRISSDYRNQLARNVSNLSGRDKLRLMFSDALGGLFQDLGFKGDLFNFGNNFRRQTAMDYWGNQGVDLSGVDLGGDDKWTTGSTAKTMEQMVMDQKNPAFNLIKPRMDLHADRYRGAVKQMGEDMGWDKVEQLARTSPNDYQSALGGYYNNYPMPADNRFPDAEPLIQNWSGKQSPADLGRLAGIYRGNNEAYSYSALK
jgi:hypothetical protein